MTIEILRTPASREYVAQLARDSFGDMVKGVVDVKRRVVALGGELHSDAESVLLDDGSTQSDVWGINLYPDDAGESFIEFDSMINVRPSAGNRSRDVESQDVRETITRIVNRLVGV